MRAVHWALLGILLLAPSAATPAMDAGAVVWSASDAPTDPLATKPRTEMSVAIDPSDPSRAVLASMESDPAQLEAFPSRGYPLIAIDTSSDGGATWTSRGTLPTVDANGEPIACSGAIGADPAVAFDARGVAYVAWLSYSADAACPDFALVIARSLDGGATWRDLHVLEAADDCGSPDKEYIGVDPASGAVYVAWTHFLFGCVGVTGSPIHLASSLDQGATWSAPRRVSASETEAGHAAVPRVGTDARLHVGYVREAPFDGCVNADATIVSQELLSSEAVVATSVDGGATWSYDVLGPICSNRNLSPDQPFATAFSLPVTAADPESGLVAIAWSDRSLPHHTVKVAASTDGGATWTQPATIAEPGRGLFEPWIVAAGGRFRLLYVAQSASGEYDLLYRESTDGVSWSPPSALNSAPSCACFGVANGPRFNAAEIGDYVNLEAAAGRIIAAWPDDRDPTGIQTTYVRVGSYGASS